MDAGVNTLEAAKDNHLTLPLCAGLSGGVFIRSFLQFFTCLRNPTYRWCDRYIECGIASLARDASRSGRKNR
jgi:hypothetical protein